MGAPLDEAANPDGKSRKAGIDAKVDPDSVARANTQLDGIIKLRRTAHITVVYDLPAPLTVPGLTPGPQVGPAVPSTLRAAGPAMLAAPTLTGGAWTPTLGRPATNVAGPQVVRLAPKTTPVAVYLDGVEIAHRIEARRALAATTSVRRTA